jgi:hypothetical protein
MCFVGSRLSAPGPQERRFAAYIEGLATAAGHEDRHTPLKDYCKGLLLPGERKSIEPLLIPFPRAHFRHIRRELAAGLRRTASVNGPASISAPRFSASPKSLTSIAKSNSYWSMTSSE